MRSALIGSVGSLAWVAATLGACGGSGSSTPPTADAGAGTSAEPGGSAGNGATTAPSGRIGLFPCQGDTGQLGGPDDSRGRFVGNGAMSRALTRPRKSSAPDEYEFGLDSPGRPNSLLKGQASGRLTSQIVASGCALPA
jgi:hypothetical protein